MPFWVVRHGNLAAAPSGEQARVDIYAIADGYQIGGAKGADHPLAVALMRGDRVVAGFRWLLPDIADGCADPISYARDIDLDAADWARLDRIALDAAPD